MEVIKANVQKHNRSSWKFNQLDLNCLNMIIKGTWMFNYHIDEGRIKSSLEKLLEYYPYLSGRIKDKSEVRLDNSGIFFSFIKQEKSIVDVKKNIKEFDLYSPLLNIKRVVRGQSPLLSVKVIMLSDGCLLSIHCAHVCMDGNSYFKMVNDLSKLYNKESIGTYDLIGSNEIFERTPAKDEAQRLMIEKKWKAVPFKALFQFTFQKIFGIQKIVSTPIFISEERLNELRNEIEKNGGQIIGNHALLSAVAVKLCYKLNDFEKTTLCTQVSVVDLRGKLSAFPKFYLGNAVTNIPSVSFNPEMKLMDLVKIIDEGISKYLSNNSDILEEHFLLNIAGAKYKIPYTPFDLYEMNSRKPTCFYVNNLLKFDVYNVNFGNGEPILVLPNDLPDAIKIWPSGSNDLSVNIYLRGYLGKRFNKLRDKERWLNNFFDELVSV